MYVYGIPYTELFCTMDNHDKFHAVSSSDSVSTVLPVTYIFITSARHSLSQAFVTSSMNCVIFLDSNKIRVL